MTVAPLPSQRHLFDMPDDVAYLNCAYMSPLARPVVAAGEAGVRRKATPWTISAADFFTESERARALFADLIGADAEGVAIVPAASYGIAVAANNLPLAAGQRVLVLAEQFPSHVYAWRALAGRRRATLVTVPRPADGDWTRAVLEHLDARTGIVAVPHCHWTDGGLLDLPAIGARARAVGARLVLDLTQSAGAWPFDTNAVRPDFLVCAGYKWLLGPYSLGFLYAAPEWRGGEPLEHNWIARAGSEDFAGLVDYRDELQPGARRYDVGERSNFVLTPMLTAALDLLLGWGVERIAATLAARTAAVAERAGALGLATLPASRRAGHYLGLRLPGPATPAAASALAATLAARQVHVSVRGTSIRVTPHVYNTDADVDRLFSALEAALD